MNRPVQADDRPPIDAAIDEVERRELEAAMAKLEPREVGRIPLLTNPHRWTPDAEITITAVPDQPTLLMWDGAQGGWRPVFLDADTKWRVVPDRSGLWTPGGQA